MRTRIFFYMLLLLCLSCSDEKKMSTIQSDNKVTIFPDYSDVTIPTNVAPLNFHIQLSGNKFYVLFKSSHYSFTIKTKSQFVTIPESKWKTLLSDGANSNISITIKKEDNGKLICYPAISLKVAQEKMDPYIVYRLIDPGYALWNQMGIYQRNIENYTQTAIYENKLTNYNCVNCHSFCMQDPNKMLFHMRAKFGGTVIIDGKKIEILNTKTDKTISALVYPSWHPSGKFVAFSVNKTTQGFHSNQRVEVFDFASDVVVYDIHNHQIITTNKIFSPNSFETFPTFSPNGKTLYFCSASACPMPDSLNSLKYDLCSITFDSSSKTFGDHVDTLVSASRINKSISLPRVSPDGKYLICTVSSYGTFPIWHEDADLYLINLQTGKGSLLDDANSNDTDSYHSWSSNSRWIVFSSRRLDGLYSRPYFAYINKNGKASKPFLLPQKEKDYYTYLNKSFNIPEFVKGKVVDKAWEIKSKARNPKGGTSISFLEK